MKVYLVKMIDIVDHHGYIRSDRYIGVFDSLVKAEQIIKEYKNNPHLSFNYIVTEFDLNSISPAAPAEKRKSAILDNETVAKLGYSRVSANKGKY